MCQLTHSIALCQHPYPYQYIFCLERTEKQVADKQPCVPLGKQHRTPSDTGIHNGHYTDFCCSQECCDVEITKAKTNSESARLEFNNEPLPRREWEIEYEKWEEARDVAQGKWHRAQDVERHVKAKHASCEQKRAAAIAVLRVQQPCLFD